MQYSTCWIGQDYRFAGDIKQHCGQQAWGKSLRRLNRTTRSVPSLFDGIVKNKAQTSSPKGGREYTERLNLAEHWNPNEL